MALVIDNALGCNAILPPRWGPSLTGENRPSCSRILYCTDHPENIKETRNPGIHDSTFFSYDIKTRYDPFQL
jgi:hypothetical protein